MDGTATFTIVASTMIMATPTLSMVSPSQRRRALGTGETVVSFTAARILVRRND